ncbi:MAG: ABC transporter ATP-binding protein [Bacteroidales bacterium]|nr:ABC transporter ATP-binding protein [Bacteroidales bacterium]
MSKTVMRFDDVCFSYPGGREALSHVSFEIAEGEKVALVGLNGSGKSTLLLHADALLMPSSGKVEIDGIAVTDKNAAKSRMAVGMVFQNSDDQLFMPTVEADVAFGPRNMGLDNGQIAARVDEALQMTCCSHLRDRQPFRLSGGQKRMVSIATVLSMQPRILVFDEPTSGLDFAARAQFISIVDRLPHTVFMSSHDMELVNRLCTRAIVLDRGHVTYDGPVDTLPYPTLTDLNDISYETDS